MADGAGGPEQRILLFGKNGQLGWELQRALLPLGEVIALDIEELDLTKPGQIEERIRSLTPQLLVNASAYTAVDQAESEPDLARAVNARAPAVMAEEARSLGALLIHYSTDYVFDGSKREPYREEDAVGPLNTYGQTKLEGEWAIRESGCLHFIMRTSWVYSFRAPSFPVKVLRWAAERESLSIVDDQVGSPTWSRALAEVTTCLLAESLQRPVSWLHERTGLYHLAGAGAASRFEWAKEVLNSCGSGDERSDAIVHPAKSSEFPSAAQRPAYSALSSERFARTFNLRLPPWRASLRLAMDECRHADAACE